MMATAPDLDSQELDDDTLPPEAQPITLADILTGDNLVQLLDDNTLNRIGSNVVRDYEIDRQSCHEWLERYDDALDLAMQVRSPKTFPWAGASNIKYPLLTVAAIQFQARAYPAIVDGANLVKGRVLGPDPDGQKRKRADRIGQHMSWQLLYKMKGWEESTDRLLLMLPIVGCVMRKSYFDPIAGTNCSDMIPANDFIVNYFAKSLDAAPRYTQVLHLYPYEARERIAAKLWRQIPIDPNAANDDDEDGLIDYYEQHRMIDLDEDGIPEHYVVTCTTEGHVARIVPCFDAGDVYIEDPSGGKVAVKASTLTAEQLQHPDTQINIVRVERQQYFTKYGFIPSPDGAFYDMGFGTLTADISASVDTTINQIHDAATLQNAGGGFIGSGVTMKGGRQARRIGEWTRAEVVGGTLRDNIVPLPTQGPSAVLFQLLGMLIEAAKQITSVQDVLTGASQGSDASPTTVMAQIEQGLKVMTGILKRIHRAFGTELKILRRLNRDHMDEEEYFQLNDEDKPEAQMGHNGEPAEAQQLTDPNAGVGHIGRADYEDDDLDVIPVSDPTIVSDVQKMIRAQALQPYMGNPLVNQKELLRRQFEALGETDIAKLLTVPQAPNPELVIEGMKQTIEKQKVDNATITAKSNAANAIAAAAAALAELGLTDDAATLAGMATQLGAETDGKPATGPGDVPPVEGQPADPSVPQIPQGPSDGPDAGMGAGPTADTGESGVGGAPGGAGGPVA